MYRYNTQFYNNEQKCIKTVKIQSERNTRIQLVDG
jgi:hypothetical protein